MTSSGRKTPTALFPTWHKPGSSEQQGTQTIQMLSLYKKFPLYFQVGVPEWKTQSVGTVIKTGLTEKAVVPLKRPKGDLSPKSHVLKRETFQRQTMLTAWPAWRRRCQTSFKRISHGPGTAEEDSLCWEILLLYREFGLQTLVLEESGGGYLFAWQLHPKT